MKLKHSKILVTILGFAFSIAHSAYAYSIADAVRSTRENNSKLKSAREETKAVRTEKVKALTTFLPKITADSKFTTTYAQTDIAKPTYNGESRYHTLTATQPLFSGFSSYYFYEKAKNLSGAADASLHATKDYILFNTVSVYESLTMAKELYNFNVKNEEVFTKHLHETEERFNLGEATVTDVAQAQSRLADAASQKASARGDVSNVEAAFFHIVGEAAPQDLEPIEIEAVKIPNNLEEFLEIVMQRNPNITGAKSSAKAATNDTQIAFTKLAPVVTAYAQYTRTNDRKSPAKRDFNQYFIEVQFPIFNQGSDYAEIRRARYLEKKGRWDLEEAKHFAREESIKAWSEYHTKKAVVEASKQAIIATQKALQGVTEEARVGTRTTLDVLDAEKDYFNAKVLNIKAQRDYTVALFAIRALMGDLGKIPMLNK